MTTVTFGMAVVTYVWLWWRMVWLLWRVKWLWWRMVTCNDGGDTWCRNFTRLTSMKYGNCYTLQYEKFIARQSGPSGGRTHSYLSVCLPVCVSVCMSVRLFFLWHDKFITRKRKANGGTVHTVLSVCLSVFRVPVFVLSCGVWQPSSAPSSRSDQVAVQNTACCLSSTLPYTTCLPACLSIGLLDPVFFFICLYNFQSLSLSLSVCLCLSFSVVCVFPSLSHSVLHWLQLWQYEPYSDGYSNSHRIRCYVLIVVLIIIIIITIVIIIVVVVAVIQTHHSYHTTIIKNQPQPPSYVDIILRWAGFRCL